MRFGAGFMRHSPLLAPKELSYPTSYQLEFRTARLPLAVQEIPTAPSAVISECSSARLERCHGVAEVAGSNPATQTFTLGIWQSWSMRLAEDQKIWVRFPGSPLFSV